MEEAAKVLWGPIKTLLIDNLQSYKKYLDEYDTNMCTLRQNLDDLYSGKQDIERKVLDGKARLEKITARAELWLERVIEITKDEELKMLMLGDIEVAKAALMLMEADLGELIEVDCEIRDIVANVMKNISKGKSKSRSDGNNDTNDRANRNRDVSKILERVVKERIEEFKRLMKSDPQMAVAAMQLLDGHGDLDKLTKEDQEMADIVNDAKVITVAVDGDENLSKDNQLIRGRFRTKVRNMLRPVSGIMMNDAFMKALPETVSLGAGIMMSTIGNRDGLANEMNKNEDGKTHRRRCCCMVCFEHYRDRYQLSLAAESMVEKIKPLIEKPIEGQVTVPIRAAELEAIPTTHLVCLRSRKQLVEDVVKALQDDNVDAVGAYGMGGTGKTTLAKEVGNNKVKDIFECIIMVEISEVPNIERIQDHIADALDLPVSNVHSIQQRATKLYNRLKSVGKQDERRNVLLILDNIWHHLNMIEVGIPLENCKLLLTTREENICKEMGVKENNIFKVGVLDEEESNNLFESQVGNMSEQKQWVSKVHTDSCGDYKSIVKRLLNKCGGLPLTIVTTANALKGKNLTIWQQFANELEKPISSQVDGAHHEAYLVLETSYKLMEKREKKMFFLLACLCPLGSSISIEVLMRYGIGLNLFNNVNKLSEAMDQANKWADELISSSMLLEGDSKGYVKIHDVVRASTISFAEKDKHTFLVECIPRWMCEETFEEYTSISLASQSDYLRLSGLHLEKLQILIMKGGLSSDPVDSSFFCGMKNLKVLAVFNVNFEQGLPESMGNLSNLRTLVLEGCKLGDISLIGKLLKLRVLSFRDSLLNEFPTEIGNLRNTLRLLDMNGCNVATIPVGLLSKLYNLEGLYLLSCIRKETISDADSKPSKIRSSIVELNKFDHLNVLELDALESEELSFGDQTAKRLAKFRIFVGHFDSEDRKKSNNFQSQICRYILELKGSNMSQQQALESTSLRALLHKVESLNIRKCSFLRNGSVGQVSIDLITFLNVMPDNRDMVHSGREQLGMFLKLQELELTHLKKLEYLMPLAIVPRLLTKIKLSYCNSLKYLFADDEDVGVIELRYLKLLEFYETNNLISMVGHPNSSTHADSAFFNRKVLLPSLEVLDLRDNNIGKLWSSKEVDSSAFQNLKVISIDCCEKMQTLGPPSTFTAFLRLERLSIRICSLLQTVITKETEEPEIPEEIISFPQLIDLNIHYNYAMESFYGGKYKLQFPKLNKLELSDIPKLTRFSGVEMTTTLFHHQVVFPSLEELKLSEVGRNVSELWSWKREDDPMWNPIPNLKKLSVRFEELTLIPAIVSKNLCVLKVDTMSDSQTNVMFSSTDIGGHSIWTYEQLPRLEELYIINCKSLEYICASDEEDVDAMSAFLGRLKKLQLYMCFQLKVISLHIFKSLRSLEIIVVGWEYIFSDPMVVQSLELLDTLRISDCGLVQVLIRDKSTSSVTLNVKFPRLKSLFLFCLPAISKISSTPNGNLLFPSLERIHINNCPNLKSFWEGSFIAPKLQVIWLKGCRKMNCFLPTNQTTPDPTCAQFPCLEKVSITNCRQMESFCSRPVTTAPNLKKIKLKGCRDLKCLLNGNPVDDDDDFIELPLLHSVNIVKCPNMELISMVQLKAPELIHVRIDGHECSMQEIDDINQIIPSYCSKISEVEEDDDDDDDDDYDDEYEDEEEDEDEDEYDDEYDYEDEDEDQYDDEDDEDIDVDDNNDNNNNDDEDDDSSGGDAKHGNDEVEKSGERKVEDEE